MVAGKLAKMPHGGDRKKQAANLRNVDAAQLLNVSERSVKTLFPCIYNGFIVKFEMKEDIMTVISFEDFRNERRLVYLDLSNVISLPGKKRAAPATYRPHSGYLPVYAHEAIEAATRAMAELPLTDRERAFVADMQERAKRYGDRFGMTENQLAWFRSIAHRLDNAIQA